MSLKLENILVFTIYNLFKDTAHRWHAVPVFAGRSGSVVSFCRQTVPATVLRVSVRRFRAAEPEQTVMGCRYRRRRKPCWGCCGFFVATK